ncbi:MAG: Uma2 family endonuclease [Limnoraphis sp. WC205]|jgi:Uma2 family endonuclease|nr:Uma2 family endonuclease [Limnoraphis sp. WC205]
MNTTQIYQTESSPLIVQLHPVIEMTDEQFFAFCQINRELRIERTAHGELIIMSPTGSETEERNFDLIGQLWMWTRQDGTGVGFGSSGGFMLPNGAVRSPDAAWIKKSRWEAIPQEQRQTFAPICPDFVVELRSASDRLKLLQEKMLEYIENGAILGWLIDPIHKQVYIYRPQTEIECLENPATVSGDPVLSGFVLDLNKIFSGISET